MSGELDLGEVATAVVLSITSIIVYAVIGGVLARFNLLAVGTDSILGRIVFLLFLPALLFLEVSKQQESGGHLIVATLVTLLVGTAVGALAALLAQPSMRRTVVVCVALPNMASIPLALAQYLFVGGVLKSVRGADAALANIAITLVLLEALIWGVVYSVMVRRPSPPLVSSAGTALDAGDEMQSVGSDDDAADDTTGAHVDPEPLPTHRRRLQALWMRVKGPVLRVVNPPFVAVMLALVVANTDARMWFHKRTETDAAPPLAFVVGVLRLAANCVVPCLLLIVGLSFAHVDTLVPKRGDALNALTLGAVCVARLLVVPALMLGLMHAARAFFNPTERILVLMQACTPINIDILIIAHLNKAFVAEATLITFWTYLLSLATMVGWLIAIIVLYSEDGR